MPGPAIPILVGLAALALLSRKASAAPTKPGGGAKPPGPTPTPGGGGISGLGCPVGAADNGVANLPVTPLDYRTPVQAALAVPIELSNPGALDTLAAQLDGCGQSKAGDEVRARAAEVRAKGGGLALPDLPLPTPPTGGPDVASSPSKQWRFVVAAGDNAQKITKVFFGNGTIRNSDTGQYRYVELILRNAAVHGTIGDPNNPNTKTEAAPFGFNFARLNAGDRLFVPTSWNAWVTPDGKFRGQPSPFPNA